MTHHPFMGTGCQKRIHTYTLACLIASHTMATSQQVRWRMMSVEADADADADER